MPTFKVPKRMASTSVYTKIAKMHLLGGRKTSVLTSKHTWTIAGTNAMHATTSLCDQTISKGIGRYMSTSVTSSASVEQHSTDMMLLSVIGSEANGVKAEEPEAALILLRRTKRSEADPRKLLQRRAKNGESGKLRSGAKSARNKKRRWHLLSPVRKPARRLSSISPTSHQHLLMQVAYHLLVQCSALQLHHSGVSIG